MRRFGFDPRILKNRAVSPNTPCHIKNGGVCCECHRFEQIMNGSVNLFNELKALNKLAAGVALKITGGEEQTPIYLLGVHCKRPPLCTMVETRKVEGILGDYVRTGQPPHILTFQMGIQMLLHRCDAACSQLQATIHGRKLVASEHQDHVPMWEILAMEHSMNICLTSKHKSHKRATKTSKTEPKMPFGLSNNFGNNRKKKNGKPTTPPPSYSDSPASEKSSSSSSSSESLQSSGGHSPSYSPSEKSSSSSSSSPSEHGDEIEADNVALAPSELTEHGEQQFTELADEFGHEDDDVAHENQIVEQPSTHPALSSSSYFTHRMGCRNISWAPTSRAKCPLCTDTIDKNSARLEYYFHPKKPWRYIHTACIGLLPQDPYELRQNTIEDLTKELAADEGLEIILKEVLGVLNPSGSSSSSGLAAGAF